MTLSHRVVVALRLLVDGFGYASDLGVHAQEFAVDVATLRRNAVAEIDIRWMISRALVVAVTENGALDESMQQGFSETTQLVITPQGLEIAKQLLSSLRASANATEPSTQRLRPTWDSSRRELRVGASIVKRFRVPAMNQALVLQCFEEEGWPTQLVDPLPPAKAIEPKRRLHDTILALNRGQTGLRVRFRGDGTGMGVLWELEPSSLNECPSG